MIKVPGCGGRLRRIRLAKIVAGPGRTRIDRAGICGWPWFLGEDRAREQKAGREHLSK
jgi:hypothetical protein